MADELRQFLISNGFTARHENIIYEDQRSNMITVGGILLQSVFTPSNNNLKGLANELCTKLLKKRKEIETCADRTEICYTDVVGSDYLQTCEHKKWRGLILASDWPWSISSIVCEDCGGLVAPYKLPITNEIAESIWLWHVQSDCVEQCWSASGELESWADSERHHPSSRINQLGRSIITRLRSECGIPSWLYIPSREQLNQHQCPNCEDEMNNVSSVKPTSLWNYRCDNCGIVDRSISVL